MLFSSINSLSSISSQIQLILLFQNFQLTNFKISSSSFEIFTSHAIKFKGSSRLNEIRVEASKDIVQYYM